MWLGVALLVPLVPGLVARPLGLATPLRAVRAVRLVSGCRAGTCILVGVAAAVSEAAVSGAAKEYLDKS